LAPEGDVVFEGGTQDALVDQSASTSRWWSKVEGFIDRCPSADDVRSHRLQVLAAKRFRSTGRVVPEDFVVQERLAALATMAAPIVLQRVRDAVDDPLLLTKGPEVAADYPDPAWRAFGDLDLLAPNAEAVQQTLLAAGFGLVGDPKLYVDIHHLRPVLAPGTHLPVEIHIRPKWFGVGGPPAVAELLEAAVPSTVGVDGLLAPCPEHHALLLAVHSWAHEPLRRLRDLVDVAAVLVKADEAETARVARSWNVGRLWSTTRRALDAVLGDAPPPRALRSWARNLLDARERTVLEQHLERWLSDFSALPTGAALRGVPRTLVSEIRPRSDERWRDKALRSVLAVKHAGERRSQHEAKVDAISRRDG
jgi:hypothetical protein